VSLLALDWMGAASGAEVRPGIASMHTDEARKRLQLALVRLEQWPLLGGDLALALEHVRHAEKALASVAVHLRQGSE
jgi:hypothetical protein